MLSFPRPTQTLLGFSLVAIALCIAMMTQVLVGLRVVTAPRPAVAEALGPAAPSDDSAVAGQSAGPRALPTEVIHEPLVIPTSTGVALQHLAR